MRIPIVMSTNDFIWSRYTIDAFIWGYQSENSDVHQGEAEV